MKNQILVEFLVVNINNEKKELLPFHQLCVSPKISHANNRYEAVNNIAVTCQNYQTQNINNQIILPP